MKKDKKDTVTKEDFETIRSLADEFEGRFIQNYSASNKPGSHMPSDPKMHLATSIKLHQALMLDVKRWIAKAFPPISWRQKTKRYISMYESMIPRLAEVFNEKSVINAVPETAKNDKIIELVESLGGRYMAGAIKKSMKPS